MQVKELLHAVVEDWAFEAVAAVSPVLSRAAEE